MRQPTYADEYCAGFINKDVLPNANYVIGGLDSPNTSKFVLGDPVYWPARAYATGSSSRWCVSSRIRTKTLHLRDKTSLVKATGHAYAELGRIKVLDTRNHTPVALVEYSCEPMVRRHANPFAEKTHVTLREAGRLDRFLLRTARPPVRLVLARDFDTFLGMGSKVFVNVGANQGVKVGDYFRAVRPYWLDRDDEVDSLSLRAFGGGRYAKESAVAGAGIVRQERKGPVIHMSDYPRRSGGEMVVLSVTPTSSTAMVIFALEDLHLGDFAEME